MITTTTVIKYLHETGLRMLESLRLQIRLCRLCFDVDVFGTGTATALGCRLIFNFGRRRILLCTLRRKSVESFLTHKSVRLGWPLARKPINGTDPNPRSLLRIGFSILISRFGFWSARCRLAFLRTLRRWSNAVRPQ